MHFRNGGSRARPSAPIGDSRSPTRFIGRLSQKPIVLCSRSVAIEREIAAAHSPSRYLHIEAVFVFDGWLEHLSAAGKPGGEPALSQSKTKKGIQT
jgi:hypothetical protein